MRVLAPLILALLLVAGSAMGAADVFDNGVNQGGTGDNDWDDDTNWFDGSKPVAADTVQISADCHTNADYSATVFADLEIDAGDTLTVQNGGDIRFDTNAMNIAGTLVVQAGGAFQFSNVACTVAVGGTITMDGGTINLVRTAATTYLVVQGTVTTTANGGTINLSANAADDCYVAIGAAGSVTGFSAAVRLAVDTTVGANPTFGVYLEFATARAKWLNILGKTSHCMLTYTGGRVESCILRGVDASNKAAAGIYNQGGTAWLSGCILYHCTYGLHSYAGDTEFVGCTFGQTELGAAAANTYDLFCSVGQRRLRLSNCLLASATELSWNNAVPSTVISTAHDQDKTDFKIWDVHPGYDVWHVIAGESTIVHTGGGKAVSFVTASDTSTDERYRLRFPIALWPATHGDTIDATVWVRTTNNTNKIKIIVDPDSIYGTTQEIEVTSAAADTYELATVPQYTVNTGAGIKSVIPIVVQIEEASKTWYVDDLTINSKAQTLDYGAYDGVLPVEAIGAAGGAILKSGGKQ